MHGRAVYQAPKSNDGPQTYRLHYTLQKATLVHKALMVYIFALYTRTNFFFQYIEFIIFVRFRGTFKI